MDQNINLLFEVRPRFEIILIRNTTLDAIYLIYPLNLKIMHVQTQIYYHINPFSARIFTVFGHSLLEDRVLHKEAWVAKLLGTHLSIQVHKKVKFS